MYRGRSNLKWDREFHLMLGPDLACMCVMSGRRDGYMRDNLERKRLHFCRHVLKLTQKAGVAS